MSMIEGASAAGVGPSPEEARLRRASRDLEGIFVEQLFKAMRDTVPEGGVLSGGTGEEIFTTLLDQHVAGEAAARWERGLGDAVYRQLRKSVPPSADTLTQRIVP